MEENIYPRIILGLDISTACIGASIVLDDGKSDTPKILKITHVSPKIPNKIKGMEALFLRKKLFKEQFIPQLKEFNITDVVVEEPLLSSNNVNTVATLLRYNGMISDAIYEELGVVPTTISSYDARMYSFPELVCLRKYNKRGEVYPIKHIKSAINAGNIVLFGAYPFDVDKKTVMMNMVNTVYDDIEWIYNKKGEIKKENYDACDSLICALAYININHHGIEEPEIVDSAFEETDDQYIFKYKTKIWDRIYSKMVVIDKSELVK